MSYINKILKVKPSQIQEKFLDQMAQLSQASRCQKWAYLENTT